MIHQYMYLFVKMKVFNYSELHFSELTSFKIHTLGTKSWEQKSLITVWRTHVLKGTCVFLTWETNIWEQNSWEQKSLEQKSFEQKSLEQQSLEQQSLEQKSLEQKCLDKCIHTF